MSRSLYSCQKDRAVEWVALSGAPSDEQMAWANYMGHARQLNPRSRFG